MRIEAAHYKELSLWSYDIPAIIVDIEFICNHNRLGHVVHYFV
jgi:hypothetical protein